MRVETVLGLLLFKHPFGLPDPSYYYMVRRQTALYLCLIFEQDLVDVHDYEVLFDNVCSLETDGINVEQYECAS